MQLEFVPAACEPQKDKTGAVSEAAYKGKVVIRLPSHDERDALYEEAGYYEGGEDDSDEGRRKRGRVLHRLFMKKVRDFFVSVDITRTADGVRFETWDDLSFDGDVGFSVISEIAVKLMGGRKAVGNVSVPS